MSIIYLVLYVLNSLTIFYRITFPESWARYTQENIARSQKERAASERLRGEIDSCLRACANDMWNMFNSVNNAFNSRIRETTDARNKLQAHLQRVIIEKQFQTNLWIFWHEFVNILPSILQLFKYRLLYGRCGSLSHIGTGVKPDGLHGYPVTI